MGRMQADSFLFITSSNRRTSPTRYELVCPVDPVVLINGDEEERTLTFFAQGHAERGDKEPRS